MKNKIDQKIHQLLLKKKSPAVIVKTLLKTKSLTQDMNNFLDICRFMQNAGLYQTLLKTALKRLNSQEPAPWSFVLDTLNHCKAKVSKKAQTQFFKGIVEEKQVSYALTFCHWDQDHPKWKKLKQKAIKQIHQENNRSVIQLLEELEFIKSQGFLEKEEEVLKKLKQLEPENPEIHKKWLEFKDKWSRRIVQQSKQKVLQQHSPDLSLVPDDPEELKQVKSLVQSAKKVIKKHPSARYDFALMLFFIGHPKSAVQLLEKHLHSLSAKWLYADLLLQSRLYLNCLNFLDLLEKEEGLHPETVFALAYMRAKAYQGLGKIKQAKNILHDLLAVKPQYRLAHYLLDQWERGESFN